MKRQWKKWAALLLAAAMCLGLCSCSALDEMRENHAKWSSPDHSTISFRGETYRLLPNGDRFNTEYLTTNRANITEADVPVLLSEMFSTTDMWLDNDAAYIWLPSDVFTGKQSGMAYAREDKYDEAVALGKDIVADSYFVYYNCWDENNEFLSKVEYVEPALFDAVQKILTTVTPSGRTGSCLFVLNPACQKTLLYRPEGDTLQVCRTDSGLLFLTTGSSDDQWQNYDIPAEYQVLFEKAVGKYCPYEADFVTEF